MGDEARAFGATGVNNDTSRPEPPDPADRDGERFLSLIYQNTSDCLYLVSVEPGERYRFLTVNDTFLRVSGYTRAEVVSRPMEAVVPAANHRLVRAMYREAIESRRPVVYVEAADLPAGRKHGEITLTPVFTAGGPVTHIIGTIKDVTAQKEDERALRESEAEYRAMFELAGVGTVEADVTTGRFLRVNRKQCEITGYTREELLGMSFVDITHPDDRERDAVLYQAMVHGEAPEESVEKRYVRKDGAVVWVHVTATLVRDGQGRPLRSVAIVQDVTDRKRAEEARRESEQRFARFMQHLPGLAWVKDTGGRYVFVNEAAARAFRAPAEHVYGKTDEELFPAATAAQFRDNDRRALESASGVQVVETLEHPDGVVHHSIVSKFPIPAPDGGAASIGGMAIDITERVRAEEALKEGDKRKDEFLATLAHELRNPLAPIRHGLQLIRLIGDDRVAMERVLAMMDRQLGQMVRLIDDLLDVSRITRNRLELRRERVELAAVIHCAVEASRPLIDSSGQELTVSLPPDPVYLDADLTRLAQVVSNLLNNAAKYTNVGGHIRLTAGHVGREVVVSVRDDGIGIPAEHLPRLFEMFSQVSPARERSQGGLGIGLALVRGLVEMHGGRVEAHSAGAGAGSEFVVRLPTADLPATLGPAGRGGAIRPDSRRRILVVDDNRDGADSLATLLRLMGNEVRTAHDGAEGVEMAEHFRPQVILMDIGMPRLNGLEATRRIRKRPWANEVTIVALTGWGQEGDRARSLEAGCDGHLVKPVSLPDLEEFLARRVAPADLAP